MQYPKDAWVGVDLDKTLAKYDHWGGPTIIGEPLPHMVGRVQRILAAGITVKVFTARVSRMFDGPEGQEEAKAICKAIKEWTKKYIGVPLEATCVKDLKCIGIIDDMAYQAIPNTGMLVQDVTFGLFNEVKLPW